MNEHLDHLELEQLADVLAGELTSNHLDGCAGCRVRLDELSSAMAAVSTALGTLEDPVVPPDLVSRIDAALARERLAPSTGTATNVVPLTAPRAAQPRWMMAGGAVAAAAALVVGGVFLFGGDDASTSTSTPDQTAAIAQSSTGSVYARDGKALQAALPQLLKGGARTASGTTGGTAYGAASEAAPSAPAADLSAGKSAVTDPLAGLRTSTGLASCLASLSDPSDPGIPLALDYASFEGQPALIVVLPSASTGKVDVFVVGAECSQADAKVLFFTKLTKP